MCDGKYFFSAQTPGGYKNKMKSLSYLISCINKANNEIPRKLTMVKLLYNGKIKKTRKESEQTWNQYFEESTLSLKENFIFINHFPNVS